MPVTNKVIGKYAAKTIYGPNRHLPLIREGTLIRSSMVEMMRRQGVPWVWVTDTVFPNLQVREIVKQETIDVARRSLGEAFRSVQESRVPSEASSLRLANAVSAVVDEIVTNKDVLANISHLRDWDNYTFEHSIHVSILSTIIAKHLNMTADQILRLGTGAILHDIGKLVVPQEILQKPSKLTDDEFDVIRQHPRLGWDLVHEGFDHIMPTSSIVVLQHHERSDGSGYPQGLKGEDIYIFSRIVAVADVFDALRSERNYRPVYPPRLVLQILREEAGTKLDARAMEALLSHVAVIPDGEIVRLTNGLLGAVVEANPEHPLQPVVEVVADEGNMPIERERMDLKETPVQVDLVLNDWPPGVEERVAARQKALTPAI